MQSQEYVLEISTKRLIGSSFLTSAGLSLRSLSLSVKMSETATDAISTSTRSSASSNSTDVGGSIAQYNINNSTNSSDKHVIIKRIWDECTYNSTNNMMSIQTLQVFLYDLYYTYNTHLSHIMPDKSTTTDTYKSSSNSDMSIFTSTVLSLLNIEEDKKCISYIEFFDAINRFDIVYDK